MRAGVVALFLVLASAAPAPAHEGSGCNGFGWPVDTEIEWMKATVPATQSGAKLASVPNAAVDLALAPAERVTLPSPPSGKPHGEVKTPHAGFFVIEKVPKAGLYQVSLASPGWIDVIQNGKVLDSSEHSGAKDCPTLQKSVRFQLEEGPATIEMSSVPDSHIKLTIRAAQ